MATMQVQPPKFSGLVSAYSSLLNRISTDLPNVDADLAVSLLIHNYKYQKEVPRLRLEIKCSPDVNGEEKKDAVYAKTGRCAEIRHGHILVIDGYLSLKDVEELAKDGQVKNISGSIIY